MSQLAIKIRLKFCFFAYVEHAARTAANTQCSQKNIFKKIELSNYLSVMVIVWKSERNILIDSATAQKNLFLNCYEIAQPDSIKKVLFPRFRMTRQHFSSIFKRLSPPSITHTIRAQKLHSIS